ncbi:MAG: DUF2726 domain-containing protein [Clostridia bacterium]|nr:DUF2726 domain-containing protein [Clostridia bacterium]
MPYLVLGLLIIGAVIYSVIIKIKHLDPLDKLSSWPYEKKQQVLSPLEMAFYQALLAHLQPGLAVMAKVRLDDILYVAQKSRETGALRDKLAGRGLDFLICESATLRPVCALDFDDPLDAPAGQKETLAKILTAAHLRLFSFQPQYEYTAADFQPINDLFASGNY